MSLVLTRNRIAGDEIIHAYWHTVLPLERDIWNHRSLTVCSTSCTVPVVPNVMVILKVNGKPLDVEVESGVACPLIGMETYPRTCGKKTFKIHGKEDTTPNVQMPGVGACWHCPIKCPVKGQMFCAASTFNRGYGL